MLKRGGTMDPQWQAGTGQPPFGEANGGAATSRTRGSGALLHASPVAYSPPPIAAPPTPFLRQPSWKPHIPAGGTYDSMWFGRGGDSDGLAPLHDPSVSAASKRRLVDASSAGGVAHTAAPMVRMETHEAVTPRETEAAQQSRRRMAAAAAATPPPQAQVNTVGSRTPTGASPKTALAPVGGGAQRPKPPLQTPFVPADMASIYHRHAEGDDTEDGGAAPANHPRPGTSATWGAILRGDNAPRRSEPPGAKADGVPPPTAFNFASPNANVKHASESPGRRGVSFRRKANPSRIEPRDDDAVVFMPAVVKKPEAEAARLPIPTEETQALMLKRRQEKLRATAHMFLETRAGLPKDLNAYDTRMQPAMGALARDGDRHSHALPLGTSERRGFDWPAVFHVDSMDAVASSNIALFADEGEHERQAKQEVVRAALRALQAAGPMVSSQVWIAAASDVARSFLARYRYSRPQLPLSGLDRADIQRQARQWCEKHGIQGHHQNSRGGGGISSPMVGAAVQLPPPQVAPPTLDSLGLSVWSSQDDIDAEVVAQFHQVSSTEVSQRLMRFFARYEPHRLHEVPGIVSRICGMGYIGAEEDVMLLLTRQYGPEPPNDEATAAQAGLPPPRLRGPEFPVVLATPKVDAQGGVTVFASVCRPAGTTSSGGAAASGQPSIGGGGRGGLATTVGSQGSAAVLLDPSPRWWLRRGNEFCSSEVPLDPFRGMGMVTETVVHREEEDVVVVATATTSPPSAFVTAFNDALSTAPPSRTVRLVRETLHLDLKPGLLQMGAQYTIGMSCGNASDKRIFLVEESSAAEVPGN